MVSKYKFFLSLVLCLLTSFIQRAEAQENTIKYRAITKLVVSNPECEVVSPLFYNRNHEVFYRCYFSPHVTLRRSLYTMSATGTRTNALTSYLYSYDDTGPVKINFDIIDANIEWIEQGKIIRLGLGNTVLTYDAIHDQVVSSWDIKEIVEEILNKNLKPLYPDTSYGVSLDVKVLAGTEDIIAHYEHLLGNGESKDHLFWIKRDGSYSEFTLADNFQQQGYILDEIFSPNEVIFYRRSYRKNEQQSAKCDLATRVCKKFDKKRWTHGVKRKILGTDIYLGFSGKPLDFTAWKEGGSSIKFRNKKLPVSDYVQKYWWYWHGMSILDMNSENNLLTYHSTPLRIRGGKSKAYSLYQRYDQKPLDITGVEFSKFSENARKITTSRYSDNFQVNSDFSLSWIQYDSRTRYDPVTEHLEILSKKVSLMVAHPIKQPKFPK